MFLASEIEEARKNLIELRKVWGLKRFMVVLDSANYDGLDNYDDNYDFVDDDEYRKIWSVRRLLKSLKETITNQ